MKYIKLTNETLRAGDRCWSNTEVSDEYFHDHAVNISPSNFGKSASAWEVGFWRRPVAQDNWISFKDRKPTESDSLYGKVAFFRGDKGNGQSPAIQNWNYDPLDEKYRTYWMPLNFVPREAPRVKVDGHEVVPQKNGDLKVGCQTVASKDFEEIVRQRQEAMKS